METKQDAKVNKTKAVSASTVSIRVKRDTKKKLLAELTKINRKDLGRKIRSDELIELGLSLLDERHIKQLQDASLSNADRFEMLFREHTKKHGATTKDSFLGKMLRGELHENS